jgi:hypothetical protein
VPRPPLHPYRAKYSDASCSGVASCTPYPQPKPSRNAGANGARRWWAGRLRRRSVRRGRREMLGA